MKKVAENGGEVLGESREIPVPVYISHTEILLGTETAFCGLWSYKNRKWCNQDFSDV